MSLRRHHDVILFAFAQQQVLPKRKIIQIDLALQINFARIAHINSAAFNIFASLSFGAADSCKNKYVNKRTVSFE